MSLLHKYTNNCRELVISKLPTASDDIIISEHTSNVNKIHATKYIEHGPSKPIATSMREKGQV